MTQISQHNLPARPDSLEENVAAPTTEQMAEEEEEEVYALPASFAQQRLWFLEQWEPGVYNMSMAAGLTGNLNIPAMERAFQEIIRRHEMLRTTFKMVNGQLFQVIAPSSPFRIELIDLSSFPEDIRIMKMRRRIKEDMHHPYDLLRGPLLRVTMLKVGEQKHAMLIAMHHIISDGWSLEVLYNELTALYTAYVNGEPSPLPELPIQYADYAIWQQNLLQGEVLEEQLSYWREQLTDLPVLQLPVDHPRPPIQTFRGAVRTLIVPTPLTSALNSLCRKAGATLFMLLLGAFQTLLFRSTDQSIIPVGVPIAGRTDTRLEPLIGCFINTLVMRADFTGNPTFLQLLERIRDFALGAYEHQDIPFEKLVETLQPGRDLSANPLTQVMFALQNVPRGETRLPGLTLTPLSTVEEAMLSTMGGQVQTAEPKHRVMVENKTAMFDLDLTIWERDDYLFGEIKYNTDLFDPETIDRLHDHFLTLLASIAANPQMRVSDLSLLTEAEKRQLSEGWNPTREVELPSRHFLQAFTDQVERTPEALAVSDERIQLNYRELNAQADRLARHLLARGLQAEQLVGVYTERSVPWAVTVLALFKAGGVYLPLDPRHPAHRVFSLLEQSNCQMLLTTSDLAPDLSVHLEGRQIQVYLLEDLLAQEPDQRCQEPARFARQLAYVIYTSGSTGKPKGAMVEQRGMLNHLYAKIAALGLSEQDIVAQTASQSFDISVWQLLAAWLVGGQTRIYADEVVAEPQRLIEAIEQDGVSILEVVPSWLHTMLDLQDDTGNRAALKRLRWLIPTGEALASDLCIRWLQRYPHIPLLNAYGPTECSDDVTHQVISDQELDGTVPIGKALPNLRVYILDRQMQLQPIGVRGEIYVGGVGVGRGYLGNASRTAEIFVPDPWDTQGGARLYRTGDLGYYRADGSIEFAGRVDQQVKLRGSRIELGEIEQALRRQPGVKESAVAVRNPAPGRQQLVGYVVGQSNMLLAYDEILSGLREELPEYMVPSALLQLDALPLTPNGKLDRLALPEVGETAAIEAEYTAPRNSLEEQLAAIWSELLELPRISIFDDFFAIGGHSLLAVRLVTRIEQIFGKRLPLAALFQHRTIAALAEALRRHIVASPWSLNAEGPARAVDLLAEATLDMETCREIWASRPALEPARILLTGATGFVGTFLLAELLSQTRADIYCLVRASSQAEGERKIQRALEEASLWQPEQLARIKVLPGDLAQPRLGLSEAVFAALAEDVDVIYHNGAAVNMVYPYEELKAPNVEGTREVIRLAAMRKIKTLHYVSTLSVLPHKGETRVQYVREQAQIDEYHEYVRGGYAQSKWVAEKLVTIARSRGLPVVIYRPGRITGHSQSGMWRSDDSISLVIRGCIQLGMSPILSRDEKLELLPVDYVCRAIVALSQRKTSQGQAFHLYNSATPAANDVITWVTDFGYALQPVEYSIWLEALKHAVASGQENALAPFLELLPKAESVRLSTAQPPVVIPETRNTQAALSRLGISCPPADSRLLHTYLRYMVRSHLLKAPQPDNVRL